MSIATKDPPSSLWLLAGILPALVISTGCVEEVALAYLDEKDAGSDGRDAGPSGDAGSAAEPLPRAIPNRLVVVTFTYGWLDQALAPEFNDPPGTGPGAWERDLSSDGVRTWSRALLPLYGLRRQLTIVDGLAAHTLLSEGAFPDPSFANLTALTGHRDATALSASIDFLVAAANHPALGPPIVVAGPNDRSFDRKGAALPSAANPADVHAVLFDGAPAGCDVPARPTQDIATFTDWMASLAALTTRAFRCDRTRAVTLHPPEPRPDELGYPSQAFIETRQLLTPLLGPQGDDARELMTRYAEHYAKSIAHLAESLRAVAQHDGTTLLDHTLIVWLGAWPQPAYQAHPWRTVMLGGNALGLRTGRYLRVAQDFMLGAGDERTPIGGPHNWALVSIARLFGLDIDTIGTPDLTLQGGMRVDTRGGVPGL